ncbi:hypothetical protein HanOQP8_Chr15g0563671 [Helianthus annuus]|nr:hypothetical protein HanHA89_Chr15g0604641 [Helianthus annuus]KAJ0647823.1 hypothetical protein HanLR1_Chr15g0565961 [Helianthus annuus]KAJ0651687.1 hypothetical protein HanOQP8_Chr15g0563671 [Helianthus annuus]
MTCALYMRALMSFYPNLFNYILIIHKTLPLFPISFLSPSLSLHPSSTLTITINLITSSIQRHQPS